MRGVVSEVEAALDAEYEVNGAGPLLLLVSGQGLHEAFADRYRVVTFDHRGTSSAGGQHGVEANRVVRAFRNRHPLWRTGPGELSAACPRKMAM